ncbi:MAG: hypothetical protein CMH13_02185 [Martelella sp.]|uniref:hypothetical protein n=1 Tax=unclassified Martelella TaxID=2629616 RepID=UPI000C4A7E45|nr:hypothetical protein [Martelella sp.]MAU19323.1 hypothetical protein [Martelella sp.]
MTEDMMSLRLLVEKSADADLLREMIGFAAERLSGRHGKSRSYITLRDTIESRGLFRVAPLGVALVRALYQPHALTVKSEKDFRCRKTEFGCRIPKPTCRNTISSIVFVA